ncbi:MAG TPA: NTP transferase domain-containing protein [Candidatus Krumholzibacteria bacterium]|nr:NTP transferase domain-containing protein [Candidatus Krumholzibacteria bacterium]
MQRVRDIAVVILAAGQGKRMQSDLPKVLHEINARPMIRFVIDAVQALGPDRVVVVVGHQAERVEAACRGTGVSFARQTRQLGTGHAVMQALPLLSGYAGTIVVLNGDVPGLKTETIRRFIEFHRASGFAATVLTARLPDPGGYGRIVRDAAGRLQRIVEHKDASESERAIDEINSGLFCFEAADLAASIGRVGRGNAQNEYYLTDVIGVLASAGRPVGAYCVDDSREVAGVNDLGELEAARRFVGGAPGAAP